MPYRRRYYKRPINPDKYSVETKFMQTPGTVAEWETVEEAGRATTKQYVFIPIASNTLEGMRKVKHITLTFSSNTVSPVAYALVFVPAGYEPNSLRWPESGDTRSLYEPNQFVMSQGVLDFTGGPLRIRTPLSRNLNSGDRIMLIFATVNLENVPSIISTCKYAITLQ